MPMTSTHSRDIRAIQIAVGAAKLDRGNYLKISDVFPRSDKSLAGLRRSLLSACQSGALNEAGLEVCWDRGLRVYEWSFRAPPRGMKAPKQFEEQ